MSTLVAQTISNGTVSTSSANVIQGSAKAWVRFNGNTIRASYNVSSVTQSTSTYVIAFTNALTDANYATQVTVGIETNHWISAYTSSSSCTVSCGSSTANEVAVTVFR
jgi:hypothetical protein